MGNGREEIRLRGPEEGKMQAWRGMVAEKFPNLAASEAHNECAPGAFVAF